MASIVEEMVFESKNSLATRGAVVGKTSKTAVVPGFCGIIGDDGSKEAPPSCQSYGGLTCLKFSAGPLGSKVLLEQKAADLFAICDQEDKERLRH
jgi:hypothetical protein